MALVAVLSAMRKAGISSRMDEDRSDKLLSDLPYPGAQVSNWAPNIEPNWPSTTDFDRDPEDFKQRFVDPEIDKLVQRIVEHAPEKRITCFNLPLPAGLEISERMCDEEAGVCIRVLRAYDILEDRYQMRFDMLFSL